MICRRIIFVASTRRLQIQRVSRYWNATNIFNVKGQMLVTIGAKVHEGVLKFSSRVSHVYDSNAIASFANRRRVCRFRVLEALQTRWHDSLS